MPEAPPAMVAAVTSGTTNLVRGGSVSAPAAPAKSAAPSGPPEMSPDSSVPRNAPPGAGRRTMAEDEGILKNILAKDPGRRREAKAASERDAAVAESEADDFIPTGEEEDYSAEGDEVVTLEDEAPAEEPALAEEAPPAPQKVKIGEKEYDEKGLHGLAKRADDMDYLTNIFRAFPGAKEEVMKILSNASAYGRGAGKPSAPPSVEAPKPNEIEDVLKSLPEEAGYLREPLEKAFGAVSRRSEMLERKLEEAHREISQVREIQHDGMLEQEFDGLKNWAKSRGLPVPDRARVEAASEELDYPPLDVAYKHAYFDEIAVKLRSGSNGAAPAANGAAVPKGAAAASAKTGAATGGSRPIPRPGTVSRSAPPPKKRIGDMSDNEWDQQAMGLLSRIRKGGR